MEYRFFFVAAALGLHLLAFYALQTPSAQQTQTSRQAVQPLAPLTGPVPLQVRMIRPQPTAQCAPSDWQSAVSPERGAVLNQPQPIKPIQAAHAIPAPVHSQATQPTPPTGPGDHRSHEAETETAAAAPQTESSQPASAPASSPAQGPAHTGEPHAAIDTAPALSTPHAALRLEQHPPPRYPKRSMQLGQTGQVVLRLYVDTDGSVSQIQIAQSSLHARLDQAALETVKRQWRFAPEIKNGSPVGRWVLQTIEFRLEN